MIQFRSIRSSALIVSRFNFRNIGKRIPARTVHRGKWTLKLIFRPTSDWTCLWLIPFFFFLLLLLYFFLFFKVVRFSKFLADVRRPTWPSRILHFVRRFGRLAGFLNNLGCRFNKRCCGGGGKFEEIREV